jgi:23S rRNA pseudouridine1911/1915/1917 synthase
MSKKINKRIKVLSSQSGLRVDMVVAKVFPEYSRSHIQKWIKEGALTIDGNLAKPKKILKKGELIEINAEESAILKDEPEDIKINVISEDKDIIVVDKPSNLVVHPGAGNRKGTLLNGLIHYNASLANLPRAGLVHRLDKDTSGLLMVAKNEKTYLNLIKQLKDRSVVRLYKALVVGEPLSGGTINRPIGRHPRNRTKQAVVKSGKEAITNYSVKKRLNGYSLLEISLETGRTHQIRVHLSYLGFPIIGDSIYGSRKKYSKGTSEDLKEKISNFKRQALHASSLRFIHPTNEEDSTFESQLPQDMTKLINSIQENG